MGGWRSTFCNISYGLVLGTWLDIKSWRTRPSKASIRSFQINSPTETRQAMPSPASSTTKTPPTLARVNSLAVLLLLCISSWNEKLQSLSSARWKSYSKGLQEKLFPGISLLGYVVNEQYSSYRLKILFTSFDSLSQNLCSMEAIFWNLIFVEDQILKSHYKESLRKGK